MRSLISNIHIRIPHSPIVPTFSTEPVVLSFGLKMNANCFDLLTLPPERSLLSKILFQWHKYTGSQADWPSWWLCGKVCLGCCGSLIFRSLLSPTSDLKHWHSCGCCVLCLHCRVSAGTGGLDVYILTWWDSKFDLQSLYQSGIVSDCSSRPVLEIYACLLLEHEASKETEE